MPDNKMTGRDRMLAACRRQPVDMTPVWYMRQAGRALPEYRKLREKHGILEMAKNPDLATKISLMPVKLLGVDAAVLYADIMLLMEGLGLEYYIQPDVGPIVPAPVRTEADIAKLRIADAAEATPYVFKAIAQIKRELGDKAAVVGFGGGPFTLASYMIEGRPSREFANSKGMMFARPDLWHALMGKLTEATVRYLKAQVAAGADVIQLFESWAGALSPRQYETFVLPYTGKILSEVGALSVPTIYFGTGTAGLLELMASAGSDVMGVDWRLPLDEAWRRVGHDKGIQGNLDPAVLMAPRDVITAEAADVLDRAAGRPGHIFNLGHGVLPETSPDSLAVLTDFVRSYSSRTIAV